MDGNEIFDQIDDMPELSHEAREAAKRLVMVPDSIQQELPHFHGVSGAALGVIHSFAYEFYHCGEYQKSAAFFRVLTSLDNLSIDFWMGLGASLLMLDEFTEALSSYQLAASLDPNDPFPHFYSAECLYRLDDYKKAKQALEMAEDFCTGSDVHRALLERISLFREAWSKEKTESTGG